MHSPFEETIIWLEGKNNTEDGYINSSRIKSVFGESVGHIIATQSPKDTTIEAFWRLVLQENVGMVITLCPEIGGDKYSECAEFLPLLQGSKAIYHSVSVDCNALSVKQNYDERELKIYRNS